jgi:hypothetical protein
MHVRYVICDNDPDDVFSFVETCCPLSVVIRVVLFTELIFPSRS